MTPAQLTQMIESLVLTASEKLALNKRMANRARQFFRQQIRQQRDIDNHPYQRRTRRKTTTRTQGQEKHTAADKPMLTGLSKALRASADKNGAEVGLTGHAGIIGKEHNDGQTVSFTTRDHGFYNRHTGQWEGGTLTKRHYRMPKRTFIGWTPALTRELLAMAAAQLISGVENQ